MARAARLFDEAIGKMEALGGEAIEIDFNPFLETARLLYGGPWVAERYAAIQQFFERHGDQVIAPVREIIAGAKAYSAVDAFNGQYRLRQLKRQADQVWTKADCLLTPTAGTIYTIDAIQQDPDRPQYQSRLLHQFCQSPRLCRRGNTCRVSV